MIQNLFTSKKKVKIVPEGSGGEYEITVSGRVEKKAHSNQDDKVIKEGGNTVIMGQVYENKKDTYKITGDIMKVSGPVRVVTTDVISADYTTAVATIAGFFALGFIAKIYS